MDVIKSLKNNWLIISIVVLGVFLRTWKLNTHGILFSDAGRDLLAAQSAIASRELPLVGIPSSVPRFHQGPLTIWFHMILYLVAGNNTLVYSLFFAFLSILALIFTYEFAVLYLNKRVAIIASLLLAVSPLAVAHARVPYHITPIPLAIIGFLFALMRLWERKQLAVFWAVLSWCILMQFELALFGLSLVIAYTFWKKRYAINRHTIAEAIAAGLVGFSPQIIYDLTHSLAQSQLMAFFAWVGYRTVSLTGITGEHQFGTHKIVLTAQAFATYGQRIFSTDMLVVSIIVLGLLVFTGIAIVKRWNNKNSSTAVKLSAIATLVLTVSYLAHGGPSEAYFPPYTVLLSLILGYGLSILYKRQPKVTTVALAFYALMTIVSIFKYNFFVSNHRAFNYGPAIAEQRRILKTMADISKKRFFIRSTDEGRKFSSYLDNYFWLAKEHKYHIDPRGTNFFINTKDSSLKGYPGMSKIEFVSRDVYIY